MTTRLRVDAGGRQQWNPVCGVEDWGHECGGEHCDAVWRVSGYSGVKALKRIHLKVTGACQTPCLVTVISGLGSAAQALHDACQEGCSVLLQRECHCLCEDCVTQLQSAHKADWPLERHHVTQSPATASSDTWRPSMILYKCCRALFS